MGLTLGSGNLSGFRESLKMAKILDNGLFRVTTDERLPHAREFAHAKHLQHGYDCAAIAGRSIEDDLTGILGITASRSPRYTSCGLIRQYF
jgi:hypothetical protein